MERRTFIKNAGLTGGMMLLSPSIVNVKRGSLQFPPD